MDENNGKLIAAAGSAGAALLVGTVVGTMLWVLGDWGFLQGAFVGLIVTIIVGAVIGWAMLTPLPAPNEKELEIAPPPGPKSNPTKAAPVKAAPVKVAPAPTVPKVKPSTRLPGEEELAARKGDWKYEGEAKAPAAKKPAAKKAAPKKKAAAKTAPAAGGDRPAHLSDAPNGTADDLKKISGVGPKLEETLNSLGIWHFAQVAALSKDDIAWVDERLRFKGRIERDDWIGQAKKLADG